MAPGQLLLKVETFIKDGDWNIDLLSSQFSRYNTEEIIKIPVPLRQTQDTLFWRFDKKGRYSVRDGCRLQRGLFLPPANQSKFSADLRWSFIWKLAIPPKVRIFWWNLSNDTIPTNRNLLNHHVPVNPSCFLCHYAEDSTCHSLFSCRAVKLLWQGTGFYDTIKRAKCADTLTFCGWTWAQLSKSEFENFAMITWGIWKEKQNHLHGGAQYLQTRNITWCTSFLEEFQACRRVDLGATASSVPRQEKRWSPPPSSNLKLNFDACVNDKSNRYSVGGVLRDKQGRLLLAFGKQITQPLSVVHGELQAIKEGALLLYQKQFQDVQIATDSLLAVQAVMAPQDDLGYSGACALEVRELLKVPVASEIVHEHRSANHVAHIIASFVSSSHPSFVWVNDEFPHWLVELVKYDLH